jgi:lysine/ornithine N-monooxygenase
MSRVHHVHEAQDHLVVSTKFLPSGEIQKFEIDVLVYATGYGPSDSLPLLGPLADSASGTPMTTSRSISITAWPPPAA